MTELELEKAADEYANSIAQHDHNKVFQYDDFKAGAEWQKKHLIDKACKWLSGNCDAYKSVGYEDGHHVLQRVNNNVIDDFKKAMED